jgi:hypothetical protein
MRSGMMRSQGRVLACVAAIVVVGVVAPTSAGARTGARTGAQTDAQSDADSTKVDDFLALQADRGTIAKDGDSVTLTLDSVDPHVGVYADDDPAQPVTNLPLTKLVKKWDDLGLAEDAPNAVVSVLDGNGTGTASAYTLHDPKVDGKSVAFTAEPVDDLAADADVAPAMTEHLGASTGAVPEKFGKSAVFIDPVGSTGLIQYCSALVTNKSGTVTVGAVLGALPIFPPTVVIPNNTASLVKTSAPVGCNISIVFTTGARTWSLTMSAVTGSKNTVSASSNVTVQQGDRSSPRWNCNFTLN